MLFLPTQGHVTCDLEEEMSRLDTVDKASNKASQNEAEGLKMLKEYIKSYTCNFRVKHVQTKKLHCSALIMASEPSKRPSTSRPGFCISNILTLRQTLAIGVLVKASRNHKYRATSTPSINKGPHDSKEVQ